MDLKQYRSKIKNQLLGSIQAQAHKDSQMATGQYQSRASEPSSYGEDYHGGDIHHKIKRLEGDYETLLRRMNKMHGPSISMTNHADAGYSEAHHEGGSMRIKPNLKMAMKKVKALEDHVEDEITGGKFHFVKSLKHFGHELGTATKKAGIQIVAKDAAQEDGTQSRIMLVVLCQVLKPLPLKLVKLLLKVLHYFWLQE